MLHQLHNDGVSVSEISRRLNMDRKTVRRYIRQGLEPPAYGPRVSRGSCLDQTRSIYEDVLGCSQGYLRSVCCVISQRWALMVATPRSQSCPSWICNRTVSLVIHW